MKRTFTLLGVIGLGTTLALPLLAQETPANKRPQYGPNDRPVPLPVPQDVVQGEAYFLERIAIPPDSKLFVTLVGRVAGAEYLPLASTIVPARNGSTPFRLLVPQGMAPAGPYRVQAWIVADNRLWMSGANPQTTINSLSERARVRLRIVPAPQNIDGIGDGRPLPQNAPGLVSQPEFKRPITHQTAPVSSGGYTPYFVHGTVEKLDRKGLSPDTQIEITVADVSLADAPAKVFGKDTFTLRGQQLPLPFAVGINPNEIKENGTYALQVRVSEGGKLLYITDTRVPVTQQNFQTDFSVRVAPVGG